MMPSVSSSGKWPYKISHFYDECESSQQIKELSHE